MRTCEHCGGHAESESAKCPHCSRWSEAALVGLLRHPDAAIRLRACHDAVNVPWSEPLIRGLAVALRDSDAAVRQQAGVALFIAGPEAAVAVPALIEALGDPDLMLRRLAAAALSMVGPPAKAALTALAQVRDTEDGLLRAWVEEAERALAGVVAPHREGTK